MTIPNLTHEQRLALADLLSNKDVDVLREMLATVYDAAIKAQLEQHIGVGHYERGDERQDRRNGSRIRGLNTRAGSIELEIPRSRETPFRPTVIEQFRRSERALVSVIQEAFTGGISTRKMEDVLAAMGVEHLSKSQISDVVCHRHRPLGKNIAGVRLNNALNQYYGAQDRLQQFSCHD